MTKAINPLMEKGKEEKRLPHSFIAYLCDHLREYQLDEGSVRMPITDTPAVVGIVLYFMRNEPKTSKAKLEWQMHLLDNVKLSNRYFDSEHLCIGTEEQILDWSEDRKNGRPNLEKFLSHMEKKGLIAKKGKMYILLNEDLVKEHLASDALFQKGNFLWCLASISEKLRHSNATDTGRLVRKWINEQFISWPCYSQQ